MMLKQKTKFLSALALSAVMSVSVLHVPPERTSTRSDEPSPVALPLIQKLTLVALENAGVSTASPVASSFNAGEPAP